MLHLRTSGNILRVQNNLFDRISVKIFINCMFRQISDGKLNIELVIDLAKNHSTNPFLNMTSVIGSCETNDIQTINLKTCPQMAIFFHCLYATLYKSNDFIIEPTTNTNINFDSTLGSVSEADNVDNVTNVSKFDETTTEDNFANIPNATTESGDNFLDTSISDIEPATTVLSDNNSSVTANVPN